MKNNAFLPALITLAIASLYSCSKKDYTCECTGGISGGTQTKTISARSTSTAEKECEADNPPPQTPDGLYCDLK